jgi:PRTRC genetic system protein E
VEENLCSACDDALKTQKIKTDMSFFQQLAAQGNVDITLRIMQKGDKLTINVMPGSAKSTNKPFNITGTGAELDEGFFTEVFPTVQQVKGLVTNKEEFVEDAKQKADKKPVAKATKPAAKKGAKTKKAAPKKAEKKAEPEIKEASLFDAGQSTEIE